MLPLDDDRANLLFLLSLTAGCPGGDDAPSTGDSTGSSSGSSSSNTTAMTTTPATGSATSGGTSSTSGVDDTTGTSGGVGTSSSSSDGGSSSSDGGSSSSDGGSSSSSDGGSSSSDSGGGMTVCEAYGDLVGYCYYAGAGAMAEAYCNAYRAYLDAMYGPVCVMAFDDYVVCLSNLTCAEFTGMMPVCEPEEAAFVANCAP